MKSNNNRRQNHSYWIKNVVCMHDTVILRLYFCFEVAKTDHLRISIRKLISQFGSCIFKSSDDTQWFWLSECLVYFRIWMCRYNSFCVLVHLDTQSFYNCKIGIRAEIIVINKTKWSILNVLNFVDIVTVAKWAVVKITRGIRIINCESSLTG